MSRLDAVKEEITNKLELNAGSYLKIGLELFAKLKKQPNLFLNCNETAIGNLGISIELMLKAVIARKSFAFLFKGIPDELFMMLTYHEVVKGNINPYVIELQSLSYGTIQFNEAISRFYILFPEKKQEFKPYLSLLSAVRNNSVHSCLPKFQEYDLERVTYIALRLAKFLYEEVGMFDYYEFTIDDSFLDSFEEERVLRVKKAIEQAKERGKRQSCSELPVDVNSWDEYVTSCPVCGSYGVLQGYTEFEAEPDYDEHYDLFLDFFAESFECEACGLKLNDSRELKLAGMESNYDRSSELDKWLAESNNIA